MRHLILRRRGRGAARRRVGVYALLALSGLLAACSSLFLDVEPEIALRQVEYRSVSTAPPAAGAISRITGDQGALLRYADEEAAFVFRFEPNFLVIRISNKTQQTLKVHWRDSAFVDTDNLSHRLGEAVPESVDPVSEQSVVPGLATVTVKVSPYGTSPGGFTRPLFPVNRTSRQAAQKDARRLAGQRFRVVLSLEQGGRMSEYTFHFTIRNVRVGGQNAA